jgi:2-polyprenyl-6-methoxyphenol hydroxylase-like FAD-dependent oxidoreductase
MDTAVVGTGIAGVTLALRLQQLGIGVTLYEDADPQHRQARLPNTVGRFEHTLARERELGVDHWDAAGSTMHSLHLRVEVDPPLGFVANVPFSIQAVDFRVYLPRLVEDFESRGGRVVPGTIDVEALAGAHELVVVAVGRSSMKDLFPRDDSRSPYDAPQRVLCAGIFKGLEVPDPRGVSFNICPGVGEAFQMCFFTKDGPGTNLLFEGIPGGPFQALADTRYEDDPKAFDDLVRRTVEEYTPAIAARVRDGFGLTGPLDILQGSVTPVVRRAWTVLPNGRIAMAVGDAWITNDPITGQGANIGSHCAWALADAIAAGGPYDEAFARRAEDAMWAFTGPVTALTNAFLQPPPPHVLAMFATASQDQRTADAFATLFNDPVKMWTTIADPDATARLAGSLVA